MLQAGAQAALDRVVAAGAVVALLGLFGCAGSDPTPIRQGSGYGLVPPFIGRAAAPRPLVGGSVPRQPFMAARGSHNMHGASRAREPRAATGPPRRAPVAVRPARGP